MKKILSYILTFFKYIGVFFLYTIITLFLIILLITHGPSDSARNLFTTTMLETGALKWVVGLVLDEKTINEIVKNNSLDEMDVEVKEDLIIQNDDSKKDKIEIEKINGSNFSATMMIIHDPSRVSVASTSPFSDYGVDLKTLVNKFNAIGGVNGGIYYQNNGKGGWPMGVVVSQGKLVWNEPNTRKGYILVGLDSNNVLKIISIDGYTTTDVKKLVKDEKIRDAVTFQEEASDENNHFVKLIINGEERKIHGNGSGANPRTVIGQTEDGSILLLVTDGRGASGHLGATAADLVAIMKKYGAVNAANIDGGSSSAMYYNGEYLMTSTTLYYSNSSWRLPDGFIVR